MARIQIISDLHLECNKIGKQEKQYDFQLTPRAPILALLGDIGFVEDYRDGKETDLQKEESYEEGFFGWLEQRLFDFEHVLYVMGNHEPYGTSWPKAKATMKEFEARMEQRRFEEEKCSGMQPNAPDDTIHKDDTQLRPKRRGVFVFLDGSRIFDIPDSSVTVLGCTLFSFILDKQRSNIEGLISDFEHISDWDVNSHNKSFQRDISRLNSQIGRIPLDRKIMVLTHYAPSLDRRAINPEHWDSEFSSAFATELRGKDIWEDERVVVWAFGHTHYNCDCLIERGSKKTGIVKPIRLVAEQRGYQWEDQLHKDGKVIVIA